MSAGAVDLAEKVLATARAMNACGINRGSAGNVSARCDDGFIITPTGMAYADCSAADMARVGADGTVHAASRRKPSSEWRFHRDIYAARPEAGAVVHTHSPFATALACQQQGVPAFHYMVAHHGMVVFGRDCDQALALAVELETLCEQYWRVLQLGAPQLLPADEMTRVLAKFATYGQQD